MEKRPDDPKHGDLARGWETLPRDELRRHAMGRMRRQRCHILDLVSPTPERILFGPAATISYFPSCSEEATR